MSRPLVCDECSQVIKALVSPLKLAIVQGDVPSEFAGMPKDQQLAALEIVRHMTGENPISTEVLDFCSYVCLATYSWRHTVGTTPAAVHDQTYLQAAYPEDR